MIPKSAAINHERPLALKLWIALGIASILSTIAFYCLWLIREPGITVGFPLVAAASTVAWFAIGILPFSKRQEPGPK